MKYTDNVIPAMTSNTAPSGVASASSIWNTSYQPYLAFDKNTTSVSMAWVSQAGIQTGWLSYCFKTPKIITKYSITARNGADRGDVKNWTFEGSNNGVNWVVLDIKTNQIGWSIAEKRSYTFNNLSSYLYYRINISEVIIAGGSNYITIGELEMFENLYEKKYLITTEDNKIISVSPKKIIDLVPIMTSTTSPSGQVFYSSSYSAGFTVFNKSSSGLWDVSGTMGNAYVGYTFPVKQTVNRYSIKSANSTSYNAAPKTWRLEASNDKVNWVTLDTQTDQTNWGVLQTRTFDIDNETPFLSYRIYVVINNGNTGWIYIGNIYFFQMINQSITLLEEQSAINFEAYGMEKDTIIDFHEQTGTIKNNVSTNTALASGKVFKQKIDTSKVPIKKVLII